MRAKSLTEPPSRIIRHTRNSPVEERSPMAPPSAMLRAAMTPPAFGTMAVHPAARGLNQAAIRQMQQMHGNRHVQRMLHQPPGPIVQRCGATPCGCSNEAKAAHALEQMPELALTASAMRSGSAPSAGAIQRVEGPCLDVEVRPHPLVVRKSVHPAVREAQTKLNQVHQQQTAAGRQALTDAPLVPDCVFGGKTFNATVSFQQLVFPGQPAEHDGKIGDKTWAELDKGPGATPPPLISPPPVVPSDQDIINRALAGRSVTLSQAIASLTSLELSVQTGILGLTQALHQQTINALGTWLKVKPGDSNFLATLQQARALMSQNLGLTVQVRRQAQTHPDCNGNPFAVANIGQPAAGIRCCDAFFNTGPNCQRDVITHEHFHLVGLGHGEDKIGQATTRATMTTEQALNSADNMAQLVSEIATGSSDACLTGK